MFSRIDIKYYHQSGGDSKLVKDDRYLLWSIINYELYDELFKQNVSKLSEIVIIIVCVIHLCTPKTKIRTHK